MYLGLAGLSQGIAQPLATAIWAEIYGVRSLGAIKGTAAMASVAATATGPLLLGALLAAGLSFDTVLWSCTALAALCVVASFACRIALERSVRAGPGTDRTC
jgi:MFS family permease